MIIHRKKNAPDFLMVGAAKSGTTSLWYYLNQHPQIFMNQGQKELGYFSDKYGVSDFDEYLKHFDLAKEGQIIGEACHTYMSSPESARRIYEFNPNTKIIMILRNPVDRAYSLYNWMVEHAYEKTRSFEEALELEEIRFKDVNFMEHNNFYYMNYLYYRSGLYYEQVKRYYELFPRDNICLIVYEEFRQSNLDYIKKIFQFLGITQYDSIDLERQNVTSAIKDAGLHYLLLNGFYPLMDKFFLPRKISSRIWSLLMKRNKISSSPKKIDRATYLTMFDRYSEDITNLSKLTNVNFFEFWNK